MGLWSSKSNSSTTNTAENYDMKNQVESGGVGVSAANNSNVNVTTTDFRSVEKAFDFAAMLARGAADESAASGQRNTAVVNSALQSVKNAYAGSTDAIKDAFETAKTGEQKIMVAAALALVAIVAFNAVRKMA